MRRRFWKYSKEWYQVNLSNLLSKDNTLIFFSVLTIYVSIFNMPSENDQYLVIVFLLGVTLVAIQEVSQLEFIQKFFIKRWLAGLEIQLREINPNYDYYSLPEEAKKEINKIDQKYFKKHLTDCVSLSIIIVIYISLFVGWLIGYISFVEFGINGNNIKMIYILLAMLLLNILVKFDSRGSVKQYMQDFKKIYQRYGGSNDTNKQSI